MLRVDGGMGEAGGQVLRTSLAVSLLTGEPLRIFDIRKGRPKPGLAAQHLAAVRAAALVSRAEVVGDHLRSTEVELRPRAVTAADYRIDVGTAGSATLVVQTIAAALLATGRASSIVVQGGTHNPMAPPLEFLREVWAPTQGAPCVVTSSAVGLYPRGGGALRVELGPRAAPPAAIELTARGPLLAHELRVILAGVPRHVGDREQRTYEEALRGLAPVIPIVARVDEVGQTGPGNVLVATLRFERVAHVVVAFGERGVSAEVVASRLAADVRALFDSDVPVDEHLADQLLLPMVFGAGGELVTVPSSRHTTTQIALLRSLVGAEIDVRSEGRRVRVIVRPRSGVG
jgi:RNA 3'-terminal phosphate cyclase (ATP)